MVLAIIAVLAGIIGLVRRHLVTGCIGICIRRRFVIAWTRFARLPFVAVFVFVSGPASAGGRRALQRLFHERTVGDGVFHARFQPQRFVVGVHGLLQAAGPGKGVAPVVSGIGPGQRGPEPRRSFEVTASVGLHRLQRTFVPGLVGALPQPALAGLGRPREQRQARCQRQHRQQRAAPERQRGQQHQRQQQPVTLVGTHRRVPAPARGRRASLSGLRPGSMVCRLEGLELPRSSRSERLQRAGVHARAGQPPGGVPVRGARGCPQAQHGDPVAAARRGRGSAAGRLAGVVGEQQHVAPLEAALLHQLHRPGDGAFGTAAVGGHDVRCQGVQEQADVARVFGQRRHGVGFTGKNHERHFATRARLQDLADRRARLQQTRGLQVVGQRCAGQVQRDHQRRGLLPQRLFLLAPAGARQCQDRQRADGGREQRAAGAAPPRPRRQKVRQQVRIHPSRPCIIAAPAPMPPREQQHKCQQRPQPLRPDEVQVAKGLDHGAAPRRQAEMRATPERANGAAGSTASSAKRTAAPSGHGYSSTRGRSAGPGRSTGSMRSISA